MLKRTYRVVLDIEFEVGEISLEAIQSRREARRRRWVELSGGHDALSPDERPLPMPADIADQARLLTALLKAPEILDQWLRDDVRVVLEPLDLEEVRPDYKAEEMLFPVIETLPPRQRHRFREAIAKDLFIQDAEEFYDSIDSQIRLVSVTALGGA